MANVPLLMHQEANVGDAVAKAFDVLRSFIGAARPPKASLIRNQDELVLMNTDDGITVLSEGTVGANRSPLRSVEITENLLSQKSLWVVRAEDVVYAQERSEFGTLLESGAIKHTNLTGGEPAFCGGEIIWLSKDELIVSGQSGRYGPQSKAEMEAVELAFKNSGYLVWSMGYDSDTNRPFPFVGVAPELVD